MTYYRNHLNQTIGLGFSRFGLRGIAHGGLKMKINGNTLARQITLAEGKKVSLPIAQVKEVLRLAKELLAEHKASEVLQWVGK